MAKDPVTAERYAVDAMNKAVGALETFRNDLNGVANIIEQLKVAIEKFDIRCDHDWVGDKSVHKPKGYVETCTKCGVCRYSQ